MVEAVRVGSIWKVVRNEQRLIKANFHLVDGVAEFDEVPDGWNFIIQVDGGVPLIIRSTEKIGFERGESLVLRLEKVF